MMNTDKLMEWAENMVNGLYEGPQNHAQVLMCAQTYALLAIANELKRFNDDLADAGLTDNQRQWLESIG
jgi:hypothetical protein